MSDINEPKQGGALPSVPLQPVVGGPSSSLVEKLEGDALHNFLMDLNGFHLELWVVQLSAEMPASAKKLAQVIRERHQELLRKHGVSH